MTPRRSPSESAGETAPSATPQSVPNQTSPPRSRRWLRVSGCLLLLAILGTYLCRFHVYSWMGSYLSVGRPLSQPVDAVYVLGGGLETRPFVAAQIYHARLTDLILLPSPVLPSLTDVIASDAEVQLTQQVLERLGVPREKIVRLEQPVESTEGEAAALLNYLQKSPVPRVAIVTSDFHTRRARAVFRKTLRSVATKMDVVGAPTDGFGGSDWWRHERGVETYILEWVKLLTYSVRAPR